MDPAVYRLFARACPYILAWLMGFLAITVGTLIHRAWRGRTEHHRDSLVGGELPGLPLVLMHGVCFGYSLYRHDWVSAAVFAWWGPGFVMIAILVLCRRQIAWVSVARATSVSCKLLYLVLVALFFHYNFLGPIFAYSLWIMHDQVRLAWLQRNADRSRRLLEDWWFPRLAYPIFLFLPFVSAKLPLRWPCLVSALVVYILWFWGLGRVIRSKSFFRRPARCTDNLRDIVYLLPVTTPGTHGENRPPMGT